mgnify:CR=1 FL=1
MSLGKFVMTKGKSWSGLTLKNHIGAIFGLKPQLVSPLTTVLLQNSGMKNLDTTLSLFPEKVLETSDDFVWKLVGSDERNIALEEADVILFVCDVATGITDLDQQFANKLRKTDKPILLVGNKCDNSTRAMEAAELYGLNVVAENFQDVSGNTTRFIVLAKNASNDDYESDLPYITSLLFSVRNIPAALYKALGGFATNGVNMIKLESYMDGGTMEASHFHIDLAGHPNQPSMINALDELNFFAKEVRFLGSYPAHKYRVKHAFV